MIFNFMTLIFYKFLSFFKKTFVLVHVPPLPSWARPVYDHLRLGPLGPVTRESKTLTSIRGAFQFVYNSQSFGGTPSLSDFQ